MLVEDTMSHHVRACVRACVHACVRACACVCTRVCGGRGGVHPNQEAARLQSSRESGVARLELSTCSLPSARLSRLSNLPVCKSMKPTKFRVQAFINLCAMLGKT